jgi:S-adenosylmethionine synthetase
LCDGISDAVVDACLAQDPDARVACETLVKGTDKDSFIVLAGEITVAGEEPDYEAIARAAAAAIGYTHQATGMDANNRETCKVYVNLTTQSRDIARGVDRAEDQGAGDQGMMFGYACDESEGFAGLEGTFMPLPVLLAQILTRRLKQVREGIEDVYPGGHTQSTHLPWVYPDGKSQVTVSYDENGSPESILTVVIATQHADMVESGQFANEEDEKAFIEAEIIQHVIKPVIPDELVGEGIDYIVNGTGRFVIGGPHGDAGITGRKIIVDTYGGMGRHGGGAFSGKDPSKVDRSAAYAARWAAKHVVAAGLAGRCEIQLAYAIGVPEPMNVTIETAGTARGGLSDSDIAERVTKVFDFRPGKIIEALGLKRPIYSPTSAGGHFGRLPRDEGFFPWERLDEDKLALLRSG